MKLYKRADRIMRIGDFAKAMRATGVELKELQEYRRWKDLPDAKISVKLAIHEITHNGQKQGYVLEDTLGRVACQIILDKQEVLNWLKEHGYKKVKQWYLEDYGMDEETWEEWNK